MTYLNYPPISDQHLGKLAAGVRKGIIDPSLGATIDGPDPFQILASIILELHEHRQRAQFIPKPGEDWTEQLGPIDRMSMRAAQSLPEECLCLDAEQCPVHGFNPKVKKP